MCLYLCFTHAELNIMITQRQAPLPASRSSTFEPAALTWRIFEWSLVWARCAHDRTACTGGTRGGPTGGVTRPAHPLYRVCVCVYVCNSVSGCSSPQTDRQSAWPDRAFITVEVSEQPEPRGGRWEEAESPQLPHRTASLKPARGRSRPHQTMSTVRSVRFILFLPFIFLLIRAWWWMWWSGDVSWHAAAGASFTGFVGCVVGGAAGVGSIITPGLKMSPGSW